MAVFFVVFFPFVFSPDICSWALKFPAYGNSMDQRHVTSKRHMVESISNCRLLANLGLPLIEAQNG